MEFFDLKRLVNEGEHQHLEFKRKANFPEKIIRELVAFANSEGGILLVGVDDDGTIYGDKYPDEVEFALKKAVEERVVPRLSVAVGRVPVTSRRSVIVFSVKESRRKPHYVREEGKKRAYVRVRDMSAQASREMISLMHFSRRKKGVHFEVGEKERLLLQHLETHSRTTLEDTQAFLKLSRRKASELLITLVRAGLLRIHPTEKEDFFTLEQDAFSH